MAEKPAKVPDIAAMARALLSRRVPPTDPYEFISWLADADEATRHEALAPYRTAAATSKSRLGRPRKHTPDTQETLLADVEILKRACGKADSSDTEFLRWFEEESKWRAPRAKQASRKKQLKTLRNQLSAARSARSRRKPG
jgi:hypothetical protein